MGEFVHSRRFQSLDPDGLRMGKVEARLIGSGGAEKARGLVLSVPVVQEVTAALPVMHHVEEPDRHGRRDRGDDLEHFEQLVEHRLPHRGAVVLLVHDEVGPGLRQVV
ncbi:MAG: hypothetical protein RIR15_376, partial [Actinomycetota bacterium]